MGSARIRWLSLLWAPVVFLTAACGGSDFASFTNTPSDSGVGGTSNGGGASSNGGNGGASASGGADGGIGGSGGTKAGGAGGASAGGAGGAGASGAGGANAGGTNAGGANAGGANAGGASAGGTNVGGANAGGAGGANAGECAAPGDCVTKHGAASCAEQWACVNTVCQQTALPGCVDSDGDGYGVGASCGACLGLDCDDAKGAIHGSSQASCYSGAAGTAGVGTCHAGLSICTAGTWGPCVGQVTPSGEACNGQDDDCNHLVDDGLPQISCGIGVCANAVPACTAGALNVCKPGNPTSQLDGLACNGVDDDCDGAIDEDCSVCVPVSLKGKDALADGTFVHPFGTVQAAINYAAQNGVPRVCVSAGPSCGTSGTYQSAGGETITMADGVSVFGNYESTTWTECAGSTTTLQPQTATGVTFPSSVQTPTVLEGFSIDRFSAGTTAAVTVDGAAKVTLTNLVITSVPSNVAHSFGVNLVNGAQAIVTQSRVIGGAGSLESVGVRSLGSTVTVQNNCSTLDAAGHCTGACLNGAASSIAGSTTTGGAEAYAVLLDASPNSVIEQSSLCGATATDGAGIRIRNDATGVVVRQNNILAVGGSGNAVGVWMTDCKDAAPWIVDNWNVLASGVTPSGGPAVGKVDGIRAIGACHPVIDSNVRIIGGAESQTLSPNGIYCAANAQNVASRCVIVGNLDIQGSSGGFPPISAGVRCDNGGCMRIANNKITGQGGQTTVGVWLGASGTFVDNNQIAGGCGALAFGVRAQDSYARLQNNRISGGAACSSGNAPAMTDSWGMRIFTAAGPNEIDVNSNDIDGAGAAVGCVSGAVDLNVVLGAAPARGVGIFRNNILRAGTLCTAARYDFHEAAAAADPRIFQNDDLDPAGTPTALYFDYVTALTTAINTAAGVDALKDMTVSGTLSANPLFVTYPTDLHLQAGSPCINAGTALGAPALDMDGALRDATPDIGADEH